MKMLSHIRVSVACIALLSVVSVLNADESQTPPSSNGKTKKAAPVSLDEVKALLQQLESGKYKERNDAAKSLIAAGKVAIGPVTKAAETDDLELGARCVDILKNLYKSSDAATKAEAEKSLRQLRQSKRTSVAKWAGEALRDGNPNNPFGARNPFGNPGGIRIQVGGIGGLPGGQMPRLQREANATENGKKIHIKETLGGGRKIVMTITETVKGKEKKTVYKATSSLDLRRQSREAYDLYRKHIRGARMKIVGGIRGIRVGGLPAGIRVGGGNIQINSRTVNGNREIDVVENGRKIKITDQNQQDITVKVTETVNGKETTKEYQAKDADELKKKHPEAAKLYQWFGGQRGGFRALPLPGNLIPPTER